MAICCVRACELLECYLAWLRLSGLFLRHIVIVFARVDVLLRFQRVDVARDVLCWPYETNVTRLTTLSLIGPKSQWLL